MKSMLPTTHAETLRDAAGRAIHPRAPIPIRSPPPTGRSRIASSPRMVAQRARLQAAFGPAVGFEGTERPGRLPARLKGGIEALSGISMDEVRVHYNSSSPARLNALAYAQGRDIHLAPGQERHLAHEAWHLVQQSQGRVPPTKQLQDGVAVNDDRGLEREADVMGAKALTAPRQLQAAAADEWGLPRACAPAGRTAASSALQRKVGFEFEMIDIRTQHQTGGIWVDHAKGAVLGKRPGFKLTADEGAGQSQLEIIINPIDETNAGQVATLVGVTAPAVVAIIDRISQQSFNAWTIADAIPGSGGNRRDRYRSVTNGAGAISGQLQMTAGLRMDKLYDYASGAQGVNYLATLAAPGINADDDTAQNTLAGYTAGPLAVTALGFVAAVPALAALVAGTQGQIAAIAAMMATIPYNLRTAGALPYVKAAAGPLLARTDFSRIMMGLPAAAKNALTPLIMRTVVLNTINAHVPAAAAVAGADPVVPAGIAGPVALLGYGAELTIGAWIDGVVPTAGRLWGHNQGRDQMTRRRYPGNAAQAGGLESMGALGDRRDPGKKPIVEFRTLAFVFVNDLPEQLRRLVAFLNHP